MQDVIPRFDPAAPIPGPLTMDVHLTEIPGLFDVKTPDGEWLRELTVGQVEDLSRQKSWLISPALPH